MTTIVNHLDDFTNIIPEQDEDDMFGDCSDFKLVDDIEISSEITNTSDAIDPIANGIEIVSSEDDVVQEDEDDDEELNGYTEEEKERREQIKDFEKRCKEECDTPMDRAEIAMTETLEHPLFFAPSLDYLFRTPLELSKTDLKHDYEARTKPNKPPKKIISMPVNYDSEYQTYSDQHKELFAKAKLKKINLTVQIGGIHIHAPKMCYTHWNAIAVGLPQYFPGLIKQDSCVFERYLKDNRYNVKFKLKDNGIGEVEYLEAARYKKLIIPVYGHMLQADFMSIWQPFTPMYRYFERIISGRDKHNNLDGKKRLVGESDKPEVLRPRIISEDLDTGDKYAVEFVFHDTQSLHGIGKSLAQLAQVTKTPILDDKNIYSNEQKKNMLDVYRACDKQENRDNWYNYSVKSDLQVYQILINNAHRFYKLYSDPEINAASYFTLPRMTIGRSVSDIVTARILSKFTGAIIEILKELTKDFYLNHTEKGLIESREEYYDNVSKILPPDNELNVFLRGLFLQCFTVNLPGTVIELVEDKVIDKLVLPKPMQRWIIDTFCGGSSAMNLAGLSDTRRLNAKIQGGRCYRNRPLEVKDIGVIIDPDYDGAYSAMMRALTLPMCANPFRIEYGLKNKAQLLTIEETRNKYKDELIPGMYQFSGSYTDSDHNVIDPVPKLLKHAQDLIPSYHPHSDIHETSLGSQWLEQTASSFVYTNQITNGIFTHWQLQIIDQAYTKESRKEILDCKVTSGIIYRRSDEEKSLVQLLQNYRNYKGKDTYKIQGNAEIVTRDSYRGWFGFNLGELIVTPIRKLRMKYDKKTPENEFYKLIGNTVYGVLCSKYFPISNVVTANNITSGVRTAVYCMEKGLNAHGSITDGGLANALTVAFASKAHKLNSSNYIQTHRLDRRELSKRVRYGVIGGYDNIEWTGIEASYCDLKDYAKTGSTKEYTEELLRFEDSGGRSAYLNNNQAKNLMNDLVYNHLAEQFPNLDLFHADFTDDDLNPRKGIMRIDCKGIARECVLTGASDYLVRGGFHGSYEYNKDKSLGEAGKVFCAKRSYRKGYGSHAQVFMEQLGEHPDNVDRSEIFDQSILLKIGMYQERYRTYFENSNFQVGDTFFTDRLIREFSASAFTYQDKLQRASWVAEVQALNNSTGQSIEAFFLNNDGTVDYTRMMKSFDIWIEAGYKGLADVFGDNKTVKNKLKASLKHPKYKEYLTSKLTKRQGKR